MTAALTGSDTRSGLYRYACPRVTVDSGYACPRVTVDSAFTRQSLSERLGSAVEDRRVTQRACPPPETVIGLKGQAFDL
jgi:hypothetical protein